MSNESRSESPTDGSGGEPVYSIFSRQPLGEVSPNIPGDDPRVLDQSAGECEALHGGFEIGNALRLREIRQYHPEDYQNLEAELQTLVGRYVRRITQQNIPSTRRYLSDVILVRSSGDRGRLRRWLSECGSTYPGGLYLWVDEGDHFHVVHDCPWSNGSCRCRWRQETVSWI